MGLCSSSAITRLHTRRNTSGSTSPLEGGSCVTAGCTLEYLRPANGSKIFCEATPKKLGRSLSVVQVTMTNDKNKVVATGTFTFFMLPEENAGK